MAVGDIKVSLTPVLWIGGVLLGIIGTLGMLVYNSTDRRISSAELDVKLLNNSQIKLVNVTDNLVDKVKAIEDAVRTVNAVSLDKHQTKIMEVEKQLMHVTNKLAEISEKLKNAAIVAPNSYLKPNIYPLQSFGVENSNVHNQPNP